MKQLNLRMPDALHAALVELAHTEHRSLNAQIVVLLERAVEAPKGGSAESPPP